jgi:hypothetical protein
VDGGGGGLTVSGVLRNRGSFVKCVAIQKRLGIPDLEGPTSSVPLECYRYTGLLCVSGQEAPGNQHVLRVGEEQT